jgi:glycosyltransferase involved in cell wall biosynthesis
MANTPMVSVLITSYNREKYIAEAIESVLSSTYQNFELIIVDDCSKDNTVAIAMSFEEKDSRISVYVNEMNLGDYPNRNKAASYAKGKYIKFVDADDYIYPNGLEILVNQMENFPNAGWGLCSLIQDDERMYPFFLDRDEIYRYNYFKKSIFHKAALSSIIKTDIFLKYGGFSGKQHLGDFEFWHKLGKNVGVVLMQDGIVWHRTHDEQQSKGNRNDFTIPLKYDLSALNYFKKERSMPLKSNEIKLVIRKYNKSIVKSFFKAIQNFEFTNILKACRMLFDKSYMLE